MPDLVWFKYAMEDIKAFYSGYDCRAGEYPPGYISARFWNETEFGAALKQYHAYFDAHEKLKPFARAIASRDAVQGSTGHYGLARRAKWLPNPAGDKMMGAHSDE